MISATIRHSCLRWGRHSHTNLTLRSGPQGRVSKGRQQSRRFEPAFSTISCVAHPSRRPRSLRRAKSRGGLLRMRLLLTGTLLNDEGTSPCRSPARGSELSGNCGNCRWGSVAHREPLLDVLGLLDLVDDGDGEVLAADAALAFGVHDQLVEPALELAGALAGGDRG